MSSRNSTDITILISLIFSQTTLFGFQFSRLSHTLFFTLLLHRPPFRVFNLPFYIYFFFCFCFCFFFFFFCFFVFFLVCFIYIENRVHWEAPLCKVLYDSIKIGGHIEIMPIHVNQDQGSSKKGLLHHKRALIGQEKLSSMIRHDLVALLQDQVAFFKDSGLTFLLNACLMQRWYNCPWHIAIMCFSFIMFNCSYQEWVHSTSDSSV